MENEEVDFITKLSEALENVEKEVLELKKKNQDLINENKGLKAKN